ncbi:MAG: NADH-quinone oxidoreductase subunit K [Chloroflexi bacterium]|mgnify:CR=1 FL=1|jgi:NADH-quinone oxidoreductase subunit K|nr:NADH-quinone oxidoreductase subunit K [Chloroflexota bacterium]
MNALLSDPASILVIGMLGLLGVGFYGLLAVRNLIKMVAVLQILIKAAVLALVLAGRASGQVNLGQSLAATVIVADTVVAVIGLALAVQVRRRCGTLDLKKLSQLRG